jgi:chromosome segregation protein
MPDIYGLILETLRRHLGTRAEAVLEEGLKRLGKRQEELSPKDGETLLKGLAFRELQARLPAEEAKRVVEEALRKLSAPSEPADLEALEAGLKRFGLYLDWPEVARYRALINRLRQDPDPRLMREAKALLEALEEKLEEALLRQAKDLAHLEESLERVRHLGGPRCAGWRSWWRR